MRLTSVLVEPGSNAASAVTTIRAVIFGPTSCPSLVSACHFITYDSIPIPVTSQYPEYTGSAVLNANSATITIGAGVNPEYINGSNNAVSEGGNAYVIFQSGTNDTIDITSTGSKASITSGTVTLEANVQAVVSGSSDTIIVKSNTLIVVSGTADTIEVEGVISGITATSATVIVESGGTAVDAFGSSDRVTVSSGGTLNCWVEHAGGTVRPAAL